MSTIEIQQRVRKPFIKLDFDEEKHVYFVDNKPLKKSVSGVIKSFYTPYPAKLEAKRIAESANRGGVLNKYTGMTVEEILSLWKEINEESTTRGSRVHLFGENYPFNKSLVPQCPQEEAIVKFWASVPEHLIVAALELRMYHFTKLFGGTADILFFDTKTQTYVIADYKTNADLFKNYGGKKMLAPFDNLLDYPFSHYEIQLSLYQILLEQIGVKVSRRIIVYLDRQGDFTLYDTKDYTGILKNYLQNN
jgi:hypothetical protein